MSVPTEREPAFSPLDLKRQLRDVSCPGRWVIAFSGGGDSLALLCALHELGGLGRPMLAVHIHHGLQAQADSWAQHCAEVAGRLGIELHSQRVNARAARGQSPEAAARDARYAALRRIVGEGDVLLTAHHRGDQAETLMLQLLRGAGPAGLSAMPGETRFGLGKHARPLLEQSRSALRQYLQERGESWVEDPSNRSVAASRNYLRHRVFPVLEARWPAVERTLSRAARHQAEAQELMTVLGRQDMGAVAGALPGTLSVSALLGMSRTRLHNVLRIWLTDKSLPIPNASRLEQVRGRLLQAAAHANPHLIWPGGEMRRYRDALYAMTPMSDHDPSQVLPWDMREALPLPGLGRELSAEQLHSDVDRLRCAGETATVRFRRGGERCRPRGSKHSRALKTLLQEAGVPPWERDRIPLLYVGEQLCEVVGFWVCENQSI